MTTKPPPDLTTPPVRRRARGDTPLAAVLGGAEAPPAPEPIDLAGTLADARAAGRAAFLAGDEKKANPYDPKRTSLRAAWVSGYDEADAEAAAAAVVARTADAPFVEQEEPKAADVEDLPPEAGELSPDAFRAWVADPDAVASTLEEATPASVRGMSDEALEVFLASIRGSLQVAGARTRAAEAERDARPRFLPPADGGVAESYPGTYVVRLETEGLLVALTSEERLEAADQLARAKEAVDAAVDHRKEVLSSLKATEAELVAELDRLTRIVRDGQEHRSVPVVHLADFRRGVLLVVRQDTRATLRERPLSAEERQGGLFREGERADVGGRRYEREDEDLDDDGHDS